MLASPRVAANAAIFDHVRSTAVSGQLDFVARVNTPWTMLGLEAWLARHANVSTRGVVIAVPSAIGLAATFPPATLETLRRYPSVLAFVSRGYANRIEYRVQQAKRALRAPSLWATLRRRARTPFAIVGGRTPDYAALLDIDPTALAARQVVFHVLDEGFGGAPAAGWTGLSYRAEMLARQFVGAGSRADVVHHGLLAFGHDPPKLRADIAAAYRDAIGHLAKVTAAPSATAPTALILTSYLSRVGRMSEQDELSLVDALLRRVNEAGYAIWLKLHPRDSPERYAGLPAIHRAHNLTVLPREVSAEAFLSQLVPGRDIVAGPLSNAHFTAHALYGLGVYLVPSGPNGEVTGAESAYAPLFGGSLRSVTALPPAPSSNLVSGSQM